MKCYTVGTCEQGLFTHTALTVKKNGLLRLELALTVNGEWADPQRIRVCVYKYEVTSR